MKLAYPSGAFGPVFVEDNDFDHFLQICHQEHPQIKIVDCDEKTYYTRRSGSTQQHGKDHWMEDPREIERSIKFERYPLLDMRYLGLFFRNQTLYTDCILRKTKNINYYLNYEDKINLAVSILLGKEMNLKETFSIIQQAPADEELALYMDRLAYVILEEQKMNGEINDIDALKDEAMKLAGTKSSKEDIEARAQNYQRYMRYLLTKEDYINITEEQLQAAKNVKEVGELAIQSIEARTGIQFSPYVIESEKVILDSINIVKCHFGLNAGKDRIVGGIFKYVDEVITDPKEYIKKSNIYNELALLVSDYKEITTCKISIVLVDKNYCSFILYLNDLNKLKKAITETNLILTSFCSNHYMKRRMDLISL